LKQDKLATVIVMLIGITMAISINDISMSLHFTQFHVIQDILLLTVYFYMKYVCHILVTLG